MDESLLKRYSLGIVAVNKALDSNDIEVLPIESQNYVDGEISDNVTKYDAMGQDSQGNTYQHSIDTTATVLATWLSGGDSNRKSSPDVRRGQRVELYRYADQDKFYWKTLFYDDDLRKLETVIYTYSGTRDEDAKASHDNTYSVEISTHRKHITLHTSKADGEPFVYDIQLNTKDGSLLIQDDIGNYISLDSKNVRIEMKNADGSWFDMNRKVINGYAPDTMNLKAGNYINLEAGKDINHKAGGSINSQAGSSINDKTGTITTQASSTVNTVPNTTFTGNVNIGQKMSSNGLGVVASGGGGFSVTGSGQFTGTVNVNILNATTSVNAPNID